MRARRPKDLQNDLEIGRANLAADPEQSRGRWLEQYLPEARELRLDLGCGKGRFTVDSALHNPDVLYVGIDNDDICIARAARKAADAGVKNVLFFLGSGDKLSSYFAPQELGLIHLNFSTPFPRAKHAWMRLTHASRLLDYAKLLRDGGELHMRTDSEPLWRYSLAQFRLTGYEISWQTEDLHACIAAASAGAEPVGAVPLAEEPQSEYELKLAQDGAPVYALMARPGAASRSMRAEDIVQDVPQSLVDYLPADLEGLIHIPYGMEDTVNNLRNRKANTRRREEKESFDAGGVFEE